MEPAAEAAPEQVPAEEPAAEVAPEEAPAEEPAVEAPAIDAEVLEAPVAAEGSNLKPKSHPYLITAILAGEAKLTHLLLDEMEQRRAVQDLEVLLAGARALLLRLEGKEA